MKNQENESKPQVIDRKFEGEKSLETLLFLWFKKELDGDE